jgi:hypothetical protein
MICREGNFLVVRGQESVSGTGKLAETRLILLVLFEDRSNIDHNGTSS